MSYVFYIFFNWFFVYLLEVRGFSALEGGSVAALPWLMGAAFAPLGGLWFDRLSKRLVLQALTFYASEDKLATVGLAGKTEEINRQAVRIARSVAQEGDALVAGNLSLTWMYEPDVPASSNRVRRLFDQQLNLQRDAGVDFVIGETFSYLEEALLATERIKAAGQVAMVTMSFEQEAKSYEGHEWRPEHRSHCEDRPSSLLPPPACRSNGCSSSGTSRLSGRAPQPASLLLS